MLRASSAVAATLLLALAGTSNAQNCQESFTLCKPSGATATALPSTGPSLAPLYNDLLSAVRGVHARRHVEEHYERSFEALLPRDTPGICCNEGTNCLDVPNFNVPMCYDRFTTNFKLIDGSSGTIDSGAFTGADSGSANLMNGTFTASDKSTGNMYTGTGASDSPTDTAAVPTPFTGTGVGSAIPLTALGVLQTIVVTLPETTIPGTTVAEQTAPSTVPGTTEVATTLPARTTLITTSVPATAMATSSSAAAAMRVVRAEGAGLAGLLAAVLML